MRYVGALVALDRTRPPPPLDALPMGRAARLLLDEGLIVVLGDQLRDGRMSGFAATRDGWVAIEDAPVVGIYDRFPRPRRPEEHARLLAAAADVPLGNPVALRRLSEDKLAAQHHLAARGVRMPEVEDQDLDGAARRWGQAFAKPRYGALGVGVRRVVAAEAIPREAIGPTGVVEPVIVQRAVPPPDGWAGVSARVLVQRDVDGSFVATPIVVRRSRTDDVVAVHRGAEVAPGDDALGVETREALVDLAVRSATALADHPDGALLLELGVDAVIDPDGAPWVIEVNTRPWGRLSNLAALDPDRFDAAHLAAIARPFRTLGHRHGPSRHP
jgi:glutathione synthase/RimK-type ligase-like ATP-grasp enzyme